MAILLAAMYYMIIWAARLHSVSISLRGHNHHLIKATGFKIIFKNLSLPITQRLATCIRTPDICEWVSSGTPNG
jgi:hypothetical protein